MTQDKPFISVVIPTYNRADLIGETIESLLSQTYDNFELVIVDDGSKDNTAEVVAAFKDDRVRYFPKENGERGAARNYGVKAARGTYVTFIDSDDIAYPFALERARQQFEKLGDPACFALRYEVKEKQTGKLTMPPHPVHGGFANEALKHSNVLACIGVFMKIELALELPFEEDRQFAGTEDWLLWLKLGARHPIPYSSEICYCYFQHDTRSVMGFSEEKLTYRAEHIRKYLMADSQAVKAYGRQAIDKIYAHMLTYTSLHLAMSKKPGRAIHYLIKGIQADFSELFTRRTLGIFKTVLLR